MANLFESDKKDITRLIFVRHGRTETNSKGRIGSVNDSPLVEVGIEQAHAVAERLRKFDVDAIYSSPLLRTKQTAEIIASGLDLPVTYDTNLLEYGFGAVGNLTVPEIKEKLPEQFDQIMAWIENAPEAQVKRPDIRS